MEKFLNDVFSPEHTRFSYRNVDRGAYDIRFDTGVNIDVQKFNTNFTRVDRVKFTAIDFEKECRMVAAHTDFSGVNKKFISAHGYFMPELALDKLATSNLVPRNQVSNFRDAYSSDNMIDSHVSLLYNMLVSWYKALLRESNLNRNIRENDNELTLLRRNYRDSHVSITKVDGEDEEVEVKVKMGPPSSVTNTVAKYELIRRRDDPWEGPEHVIALPDVSDNEIKWYVEHVVGREEGSALNFEFPIRGVKQDRVMFYYDGQHMYNLDEVEDHEYLYLSSKKQWDLILKYTTLNRVERHLAAAMQILGDLTYRALPDSAEGFALRETVSKVYLPEPSYSRAKIPSAIEGDPYVPPDSLVIFNVASHSHPAHLVLGCGFMNYLADLGAYLATQHMALSYPDWETALGFMESHLSGSRSPSLQLAAFRSILTGRSAPTMNMQDTGVLRDYRGYFTFDKKLNWSRNQGWEDDSDYLVEGDVLVTGKRGYPCVPLYGAYNLVSPQLEYAEHLQGNFSFKMDRRKPMSLKEATGLANLYRMAEYNVTFERNRGSKEVKPWTSLYAPAVPTAAMDFDPDDLNEYWLTQTTERANSRCNLPRANHNYTNFELSYNITVFNREIVEPGSFRPGVFDTRRQASKPRPLQVKLFIGQPVGVARLSSSPVVSDIQTVNFGVVEPAPPAIAPQPAEPASMIEAGTPAVDVEIGHETSRDEE